MDAATALLVSQQPVAKPVARTMGAHSAEADRKALQRKAHEFEALYLTQMLQPMFENVGGAAEPFGDGVGQDVWRSMQVEQYGKALAARGGIGLADRVARELITAQEAHNGDRGGQR